MDGPLSARGGSRPIKRGRGGSAASSSRGTSFRGRSSSSSNVSAVFNSNAGPSSTLKRKQAQQLFQPASDTEGDSDAAPVNTTTMSAKQRHHGRNAAIASMDDGGDSDAEAAARKSRFEVTASENRYLQLKPLREKERRDAIAAGLIPDPLKPQRLDEAISFEGTCEDMCPEFEREEREFQKNVDRWEMNAGSNRIVRSKAVKAFHRPAAGNEQPLPSDVRPPHVLKRVLDYLFHDILSQDPEMTESHPFLRDRTRAVRQDFTMQHERGPLAIECHERIARYHILCLHVLREWENFSESQELEQLRKVLQSLNEFYDDARLEGINCPHEAEFRAYYLITHLRDSDTIRQTESLPYDLFQSQHIQAALRLQSLALRNNESRGERGRRPANSEASLNGFSRFFKQVARDETSYLLACLAESHFTDIRRGALVAMRKAYIPQNPQYPIGKLAKMLGCNDVQHCAEVAENFGLVVTRGAADIPVSVELHKQVALQEYPPVIKQRTSKAIVEAKRGNATIQSIIDGKFYSSHVVLDTASKSPLQQQDLPSRTIAKSTAPSFAKSAFAAATPPISAPATPNVQSPAAKPAAAFSFTQPSKLSAAAPAFSPSTPASKPSLSSFGSFGSQTSAFDAPKSKAAPLSVQKQPSPPIARSPLQPVGSTPAIQPQHVRKPSKQSSSPITSFQPPSTHRKISSSSAARPISPSGKSLLNKAVPRLLELLLSDHIDRYSRNAALDGLAAVHADETAILVAERQTVVEQCASELLERALEEFASEKAHFVVAEMFDSRCSTRRHLASWRRKLQRAKDLRAELEERSRCFKDLASHLNGSPAHSRKRRRRSANEPDADLPDLSMLDLGSSRAQTMPVASTSTTPFWQPATLSNFICSIADQTFAGLAPAEVPDWKCLIVVPALDDPLATWWRCKLGMAPEDEGSVHMLQNVRVEFALLTYDDLDDVDLRDVGLVLVNRPATDDAVGNVQALQQQLATASVLAASTINIDWQDGLGQTADLQLQVDVSDVNGGLQTVLDRLLRNVTPNNAFEPETTAEDLLEPLLAAWKAGSRQVASAVAVRADDALWLDYLRRFLGLLADICEQVDDFVHFPEDRVRLQVPEIGQAESAFSALQGCLNQVSDSNSLALRYLENQLQTLSSTQEQVSIFLDSLVAALADSYSIAYVDRKPSDEDQEALASKNKQAVDDTVAILARAASKPASYKKRRRPSVSSGAEQSFTSPVKRAKDEPDVQTSHWQPDRLSSLSNLIKETKALLA